MTFTAEAYANLVLHELRGAHPVAAALQVRARGKTATVGIDDHGSWVPLFRFSSPSASFNVMSLDVRHHERWEPTYVRGVPADAVGALLDELRFIWEIEAASMEPGAEDGTRTSDPEH